LVLGAILSVTLSNPLVTQASETPAARPVAAKLESPKLSGPSERIWAEEPGEPVAETHVLRKIKASEMNVKVVKKAREIINEHYKKPFGYEVQFEIDGKRYVGRIEQHYHPPGGELHPWGYHAGCSLYVVVEQG
jgi:hypothetical protein